MQLYENEYLGLRMKVPDHWSLLSHQHTRMSAQWRDLYQHANDDLPSTDQAKFLFTASLLEADNFTAKCVLEVSICDAIWIAALNADSGQGISRENIGNYSFLSYREAIGESAWVKFFWEQVKANYWIYIKTACYKVECCAELDEVLSTLVLLDSKI